ncbi:hypothetical protein H5410_027058 [Solanum commersonii]|uniref:Uncharacterized protein n=1 Tax=Solanum commersonii TaxID=4109 RepID=A0A9J5Z3A9_SOLCO|nr:hypothetical protein H5410_027058 [Solanum commersonii]
MRGCERLVVGSARRGRGRPKKYWGEVNREDMVQLHITDDMILNRKKWRSSIRIVAALLCLQNVSSFNIVQATHRGIALHIFCRDASAHADSKPSTTFLNFIGLAYWIPKFSMNMEQTCQLKGRMQQAQNPSHCHPPIPTYQKRQTEDSAEDI